MPRFKPCCNLNLECIYQIFCCWLCKNCLCIEGKWACSACFCFQDERDTTVRSDSLRSVKCLCVNAVCKDVRQTHSKTLRQNVNQCSLMWLNQFHWINYLYDSWHEKQSLHAPCKLVAPATTALFLVKLRRGCATTEIGHYPPLLWDCPSLSRVVFIGINSIVWFSIPMAL